MHIRRRSTTVGLRYDGPFGKLFSFGSPEDLYAFCGDGKCPSIYSDGVIFLHDNARQQETLQARKTAANFSVGKHYVIPQTVRTSHPAI
jgi:hypothetical protein